MPLNTLTVKQSLEGLVKKDFTSRELTSDCLKQIKALDNKIRSFLTLNQDQRFQSADNISPVGEFSVPLAVKDNYLTKGVRTTASSKVLHNYIPQYDATVWKRAKNKGAILLGKTNMDAWAHGSSTETSDYGATRNPWDISRLPGGSSGGSAAAVAADMCIAALGTETAGSIRGPASWCGIVGLKPTYGRASRFGIIAMGSSLDSPGPITKTVTDAAIVLNIIAGHDPCDATSSKKNVPDYTKNISKGIKDLKIGYSQDYFRNTDSEVSLVVKKALKQMEELGAIVTEVKLFDPEYAVAVYTVIQRAEVSSNLARYDGIRYGSNRQYFAEEAKRRIMLGTHVLSAGYYDAYYHKAEKVRSVIINDFISAFGTVDLIAGPTLPSTALPLGSSVNHPMFGETMDILTEPSSIAGLPGISLPCGFSRGLPVGMQLIGPHFSEELILRSAYAYEQSTEWHRRRPLFTNLKFQN